TRANEHWRKRSASMAARSRYRTGLSCIWFDRAGYGVSGQFQTTAVWWQCRPTRITPGLARALPAGGGRLESGEMGCMPTTMTPEVRFRTIDGLQIRYADSGGSHDSVVVLTSPWPESLYACAPYGAQLSAHARLFAVDLPGFGASERRPDLLSPRAMGEFLATLIAEADLGAPHIVGPDVGTSAALFATAAHPERIASVI